MIEIPLIYKIFSFLIIIISFWLAFWVYSVNRKSKINQLFSLMAISVVFWITFYHFTITSSTTQSVLFWSKLAYGAVSIFYIPFYFFPIYFLHLEKKFRYLSKIILFGGISLFLISIFTNLVIKDVVLKQAGADLIFNKGSIVFYGMAIFLSILVVFLLVRNYFKFSFTKKIKVQYLLIGLFIWILMNFIFNMIFPLLRDSVQYAEFGNYSVVFFLAFTAYAIVKKELFDIKIVLTSLFVTLIAILLSFDILFLTSDFLHQVLKLLILAAFLCFGYFLIKSVLNEIERIKELEHLTLKLEKANARLKDLIDIKEEFLHITSHQLRTPLTAIRGMISMWCAGDFKKMPKKDRNEMMKRIYLSTERLNNITNDMIDAMELEGGGQLEQHNFKQVSLVKIIQDTIETLKTNFDKNNLYINFKYPKKLPEIQGDENYLSQIFLNLIDNAQKYTSKGGVDINIKKENNFLVCEIADTGMGVSKEDKKCLFKKFSRGKRAEQFYISGTGLGIFIAKKVIEEHNGKISVFSEGKNKGTTFKVYLPIR